LARCRTQPEQEQGSRERRDLRNHKFKPAR
jgi:hypothetical protein